jgi:hypothetical protein
VAAVASVMTSSKLSGCLLQKRPPRFQKRVDTNHGIATRLRKVEHLPKATTLADAVKLRNHGNIRTNVSGKAPGSVY